MVIVCFLHHLLRTITDGHPVDTSFTTHYDRSWWEGMGSVCTIVMANNGRCGISRNSILCIRGLNTRTSTRMAFSGIITIGSKGNVGTNGSYTGTAIGTGILGGNGNGGVAMFACGPGGGRGHGVNRHRPCAGIRVATVGTWLVVGTGFFGSNSLCANFYIRNRSNDTRSKRSVVYTFISDTYCVTTGAVARIVGLSTATRRDSNCLDLDVGRDPVTTRSVLYNLILRLARLRGSCPGGVGIVVSRI